MKLYFDLQKILEIIFTCMERTEYYLTVKKESFDWCAKIR